MVSYTVTAELVTGDATLTSNGTSQDLSIDVPITATVTADTLVEAKQKARRRVNIEAFGLIHRQLAEASRALPDGVKGRLSNNIIIWQSVNITSVTINP